jgi:DNA primase
VTARPDIVAVLEFYGAQVYDRGGWSKLRCPFHEDRNPSATVHVEKRLFTCWVGCVSGSAYDVVMWRENLDFVGSRRFIQDVIGAGVPELPGSAKGGPARSRILESPSDNGDQRSIFQIGIRRRALEGP